MISFLARRLGHLVLTLLLASCLLFVLTESSSEVVARGILGATAEPAQVALLSDELDQDAPLPVRYGRWVATLLGLEDNRLADPALGLGLADPRGPRYFGNLGFSSMTRQPVVEVIAGRIGDTILLAGLALALIVPLSLLLGVAGGINEGRPADRAVSAVTILLASLPEFLTAVLLLLLFTVVWQRLPGTSAMAAGDLGGDAAQLVMPVAVLVIASAASLVRLVRASVADTVRLPFVRTARLKGLSRRTIVWRHILPNALAAPLRSPMPPAPWLLAGLVVVESIFHYPGAGALLLAAARAGDLQLVQALTLLAVIVVCAARLLGDVCYVLLDPKIRVA